MLVPDLTLFDTLVSSLDSVESGIQTTQLQIATGKRVNVPSDDPVAYATSVVFSAQQSALNNDVALAQRVQGQLNTADGALASVTTAINSAISVATQASDASVSSTEMQGLASQVTAALNEVIQSADLQYGGAYVFAGNKTLTAPYNPSGAYSGDSGSNLFTFAGGQNVHLTLNGQSILGDSGSGVIGTLVSLENALSAGDKTGTAAALAGLQAGLLQVASARAGIGTDVQTTNNVISDSNARIASLQTASSNLVDADLAHDAASLQLATVQQQALVSIGTDLGKFPLINIVA